MEQVFIYEILILIIIIELINCEIRRGFFAHNLILLVGQ